jgi:hypothetical protein
MKEAQVAAKMVRSDLMKLGLVVSEEKCQWEPIQRFQWCGFVWDLKDFRVEVPEQEGEDEDYG